MQSVVSKLIPPLLSQLFNFQEPFCTLDAGLGIADITCIDCRFHVGHQLADKGLGFVHGTLLSCRIFPLFVEVGSCPDCPMSKREEVTSVPVYYICSGCEERYAIGYQNSYPDSITYCPKCGKALIKHCLSCKREIAKQDEQFCPYCGKKYVE